MSTFLDSKFYEILEKPGFVYTSLRWGFLVLSFVYRWILSVRKLLYTVGVLRENKVPVPVISIGNITLGGAGKTPLTEFVARTYSKDFNVAILSRGYKRKSTNNDVLTVSKGDGVIKNVEDAGDEPYLLAKHLPGVSVYVHKDRFLAAKKAIKDGVNLIILDDGFQHRALSRSEDWVVIGGRYPLGRESLFPRGTLREPLKELQRASAIFINESSMNQDLLKKVCLYSNCPIILTKTRLVGCFDLALSQHVNIRGVKIAAFCGIGYPKSFYDLLEGAGAILVYQKSYSDHQTLSSKELYKLAKDAIEAGAEALVCTEKDSVKYPSDLDLGLDFLWASISLDISEDSKEAWQCIQERLRLKN